MSDTKPNRAWVDEDDVTGEKAMPNFLKQSHVTPSWAQPDQAQDQEVSAGTSSSAVAAVRKRFRSEDLDTLLSRTEPLLSSKHDRQHARAPTVLSVLPLPRDSARTIHWHRNGQLAVVGGNHHIYAFHAAGTFVEQLSKVDVVKRVEHTALTATGEEVLVAQHQSYTPEIVSLTTEKVLPLKFLDTRDSAVYRNGRRDNSKADFYISGITTKPNDAVAKVVAVASGCNVKLGSLSSGSVLDNIAVDDPVADVCFSAANELAVATGNKLVIFDVRKTSRYLREVVDEGSLSITSFATSLNFMAVGSSSGVVNVYDRHSTATAAAAPSHVYKNLTTSIHGVCFGVNGAGNDVVAFATKGQKGGFRLANLPEGRVIPSFPAVSARHDFIQSLTIAPTIPVLSVGERQRVTNYAL